MDTNVYTYEGDEVPVTWDQERCIHAQVCVDGLPLRPLRQQATLQREPRGGRIRDRLTGARSISLSPRETVWREPDWGHGGVKG